jgi:hypothetical protein
MSNGNITDDDKALPKIEELFKIIVATAGIVLTLLWGLTQRSIPTDVLSLIRLASIVLVVSIFTSLIGFQFIVSGVQKNADDARSNKKLVTVSRKSTVAITFTLSWLSFFGGCLLLILAIFKVQITGAAN